MPFIDYRIAIDHVVAVVHRGGEAGVIRCTKSTSLQDQIPDVFMKPTSCMAVLDVRLGLMHNAETLRAFGLRICRRRRVGGSEHRTRRVEQVMKTAALRQPQRQTGE